jgi:D-alanyl-D-alanine carboxypeptidase
MTAVVIIESCDLDAVVNIPSEAVGIEGSSIYLCANEQLNVRQLLYALLLSSANDAATALAIFASGSVEKFASKMNTTAERLGMSDSHFDNPHGLDSKDHYTTARDLARLTSYALTLGEFRDIVSTYKESIPSANGQEARVLINHNKLLKMYDGCIGVKTGFTKKSGRCLVSAAKRNGITLIAVTLNASDDWNDHIKMLDHGFQNFSLKKLTDRSQLISLPVISGCSDTVICAPRNDVKAILSTNHDPIVCRIEMYPFAYAPIEYGEKLGRIVYSCNGKEIGSSDMIALSNVYLKKQKYTLIDKLKALLSKQNLT